MSRFVGKANLPINSSIILIGRKYADILDKPLKSLDLEPTYVPDNPFVDKRLSGHADLSIFHAGGNRLILAPYLSDSEFSLKMQKIGFNVTCADIKQGEKYPNAVGDNLIYNKKVSAAEAVRSFTINSDSRLVDTKQGYARCSVCIVDDNSIITADRGICDACRNTGIDVLLISQGYVNFSGFDYGFLGGSSFKISERRIAFTGSLDSHPDKNRIMEFLIKRNIEAVFLTDLPVFDIGSGIPVSEKARA